MSRWQGGFGENGFAGLVEQAPLARMSRGQALRRSAAAVGAVGAVGLVDAAPALAWWGAQPRPIPGGFDENFNLVPKNPFIHVLPPALGFEMSTITDFRGTIAAGETQGTARGSDGSTYAFDTDMRFMRGTYIGRDGRRRRGSFGFV
jgi:hypothetical protein